MPALSMPGIDDSPLLGALHALSRSRTAVCKTDENRAYWYPTGRALVRELQQSYAIQACQSCKSRVLCAAWAFEMEDYGVWAGFSERERRRLKKYHPELVEELKMLIKVLVNINGPDGQRLPKRVPVEVDNKFAEMLVKRGFAEKVEDVKKSSPAAASAITAAAAVVVKDLDDAVAKQRNTPALSSATASINDDADNDADTDDLED